MCATLLPFPVGTVAEDVIPDTWLRHQIPVYYVYNCTTTTDRERERERERERVREREREGEGTEEKRQEQ